MSEYQLSAELIGHENDVRAVAFPRPDIIASGSRDGTVRLWHRSPDTPGTFKSTTVAEARKQYYNTLALLPRNGGTEQCIMFSGTDQIIEIRDPENLMNDPRQLFGHEANVCALDASPNGTYIVSGSWDSRSIVWEEYQAARLLDHDTGGPPRSVWAVLAYSEDLVVTGSADTNIRVFDLRKSRKEDSAAGRTPTTHGFTRVAPTTVINTPDVVRALCRLHTNPQHRHPSGADFASAGNDGVIRLWKLNGSQLAQLSGHESFIYSLAALKYGEIASSGEDRSVRIWRGTSCVQAIIHPAISVWGVALGPNDDIVSGASDGVVRVFTRNAARKASAEALATFEESVKTSTIPAPPLDRKKIPKKDWLRTNRGQAPGQVKMVQDDDGSVLAYQWENDDWKLVGTVMEPSSAKVSHNGQEYDFVWDVDVGPTKPMLKLPFNRGDDVWQAATKFLNDNELPITHLEAVVAFIRDNLGDQQPWNSGDQNPTDTKKKSYKWVHLLPHTQYLFLIQSKLEQGFKKLVEYNEKVASGATKALALNPNGMERLKELVEALSASAGDANPSPVEVQNDVKQNLVMIVTKWPYEFRLPALDILRCAALHDGGASHNDGNVLEAALLGALNSKKNSLADTDAALNINWKTANANNVMMALRVAANLFATDEGRAIVTREASALISLLAHIVGVVPGQTSFGEGHANLQGALITVAFNYACLAFNERQKSPPEENITISLLERLLLIARKVALAQENREFQFRAAMVAGNIAAIGGAGLELVRESDVAQWLEKVGRKGNDTDQRLWSVLEEIDCRLRGDEP